MPTDNPLDNEKPLHLVSLGECLVEFTRRDDGTFHTRHAGDAFNVLFYASRLGLRTGFVSAVGEDLFTQMIVDGIGREGIDISHLTKLPGMRNGLYFIELDEQGEYTFHFWRSGSAATRTLLHNNLQELAEYAAGAELFLLTGITLAIMEGRDELLDLLLKLRGRTRIVFDTNYRPALWNDPELYRHRLAEILPMIDILLPTEGDLLAIFPGHTIGDICARLGNTGLKTMVMKGGAKGCAYWTGSELRWLPPVEPVTVVDTTGAGDAFNAGFLTGYIRGLDIESACELGQKIARRVVGVRGAIDERFEE
jgi:2-dehydro-3-deoxygluconokinase